MEPRLPRTGPASDPEPELPAPPPTWAGRLPPWTRSLRWRTVVTFSAIVIVGGVATSAIGIGVTGRALHSQVQREVEQGLAAAHVLYDGRLREVGITVDIAATDLRTSEALVRGTEGDAPAVLGALRERYGLDFLTLVDPDGQVVLRTSGGRRSGDRVEVVGPFASALQGRSTASTELLPVAFLAAEDPALAERARIRVVGTPRGRPATIPFLDHGLVLLATAPVWDEEGHVGGVLYGGQLLNQGGGVAEAAGEHWFASHMDTILRPSSARGPVSTATIFQDDVRVATSVLDASGLPAVGTVVSQEVYEAVVGRGERWADRAFVVDDWTIAAYDPIVDLAGRRIGILGLGLPERPHIVLRNKVTASFGAIALSCFVLIVLGTSMFTRSLLRPLEEMASVSRRFAEGDLGCRARSTGQGELGELAASFNHMLDRVDTMTRELEAWARTLEERVEQRTRELVEMQARVARQERLASVGQLAAGVAHEINNPLGGVLTFASLLAEELPPDSRGRGDVDEIVRQAIRCREIVKDLLEFSRIKEPKVAPGDLNRVVDRTLALLEKQSRFHDIAVRRQLDPELPPALVDEAQFQQVIMNIVLNAADAMNDRGEMVIRTGKMAGGGEVYVSVTDTGCGIPKEHCERIFDPFFTTKDPGRGTGLGLAVVHGIVQEHQGRIDVHSEIDKGTTFTIILPVQRGEGPGGAAGLVG